MSNSKNNLVNLFKLFRNRPNHLAKFLLDAEAFNSSFLKKINSNSKISEIKDEDLKLYFGSIDDMKDYYSTFIQEIEFNKKRKTKEELLEELTLKIKDACDREEYEEAARIRDYIIKNNLKKK